MVLNTEIDSTARADPLYVNRRAARARLPPRNYKLNLARAIRSHTLTLAECSLR